MRYGKYPVTAPPLRLKRSPGKPIYRARRMTLKSIKLASLAFLVTVFVAMLVIVVPAEVVFYLTAGTWYRNERNTDAPTEESNDFRLYRRTFPLQKHPGQVRILIVGGSTTYGFGVSARDTWPSQLAQKLNDRYPGRFEVVDVSYLGGHLEGFISDYMLASRRYISRERWLQGDRPRRAELADWGWRQLDPDVVIIAPIVNDTAPDFTFLRAHRSQESWPQRLELALNSSPVVGRLAISHYLTVALRKLPSPAPGFQADRAIRQIRESYKGNLMRFIELWGPERKLFLLGLPWLFNADDSRESVELAMEAWGMTDRTELADELSYFPILETMEAQVRHELVNELARKNVVGVEIGKRIKDRPFRQRLPLYLDALHARPEGHEVFAGEVFSLVVSTAEPTDRQLQPR